VPHKPSVVPLKVKEETFGTTLQVAVEEIIGASTGGASITSYHV